jgi:hypothetical protein
MRQRWVRARGPGKSAGARARSGCRWVRTWFHRPAVAFALRRPWPAPHMRKPVGDAAVGIRPHMRPAVRYFVTFKVNCSHKRYERVEGHLMHPFSSSPIWSGEEKESILSIPLAIDQSRSSIPVPHVQLRPGCIQLNELVFGLFEITILRWCHAC